MIYVWYKYMFVKRWTNADAKYNYKRKRETNEEREMRKRS